MTDATANDFGGGMIVPTKKSRGRKKNTVLTIRVLRRKDSKFWQAEISAPGFNKQITTRTVHLAAAKEFAELAYRHFSRALKETAK